MKLEWSVIWDHRNLLFDGVLVTIGLTVLTMLVAVPGGIVLAMMRLALGTLVGRILCGFVRRLIFGGVRSAAHRLAVDPIVVAAVAAMASSVCCCHCGSCCRPPEATIFSAARACLVSLASMPWTRWSATVTNQA